jgi:hypothetical protein
MIDGTPQVQPPAGDPDDHLVEVPDRARPGRPWRSLRAISGPNFSTQRRTISYDTSKPRSASSSSTSR